jgi:hypothetical protein
MPQPTGSFSTYQAKGIRENLADVISNISPIDTPFVSNVGSGGDIDNTYYEWQTDALAAVDTTNAQIEGNDATLASSTPTTRLGNYTQISSKTVVVTGTVERVKKAGRKSELAYNLAKRGAELKRDIEAIACGGQVAVAGSDTVARKTAGFEAFITTNTIRGAGGADPGYSGGVAANGLGSGYPNTAAVAGTAVAISETNFKTMLQKQWTQGGKPDLVLCGPSTKVKISGFAGIATRYRDVPAGQQAAIVGAADVYVSDFGEVTIVPSRFKGESTMQSIDTDYVGIVKLRDFFTIDLAKTGDSEKKQLLVEWGVKVQNPLAHAIYADFS